LTIGEAAAETGLSQDTLRYYERIGILLGIPRNASGHRRYPKRTIEWLGMVGRLRTTGMPVDALRRYAALARAGRHTLPERREILAAHAGRVEREAVRLNDVASLLRRKLERFDEAARQT